MIKSYYLYDHHCNGVYYIENYYTPKTCGICGDGDQLIGEFTSPKQLKRLIEKIEIYEDWYIDEVVAEFTKEWLDESGQKRW